MRSSPTCPTKLNDSSLICPSLAFCPPTESLLVRHHLANPALMKLGRRSWLLWAFTPYSTYRSWGLTYQGMPPLYVPLSRFGYLLSGLLPPKPLTPLSESSALGIRPSEVFTTERAVHLSVPLLSCRWLLIPSGHGGQEDLISSTPELCSRPAGRLATKKD